MGQPEGPSPSTAADNSCGAEEHEESEGELHGLLENPGDSVAGAAGHDPVPDESRGACPLSSRLSSAVFLALVLNLLFVLPLARGQGGSAQSLRSTSVAAPSLAVVQLAQAEGLVAYDAGAFADFQPRIRATEADIESPAANVYRTASNDSDVWSRIGYCRHGRSLLPDIPSSVCNWRTCVEVDGRAYDVDRLLLGKEVATLPSADGCHKVAGGQTASSIGIDGTPLLSFIYTIHNSPLLAAKALLASFRTAHEISSAEFVVLDDGSTEDMSAVARVLSTLQSTFGTGIVKWRAANAYGYTKANTMALRLASGTYACLMNSDVFPLPGWLAGLYHTLRTFPGAGMAGPLQLSPKGSVMEAGGTVFQKGHPYNIGRPSQPKELPYLHSHSVDYISAACLMLNRREFLDLGLFDPQFAPAYFEDTDAALTMRKAGRLTVVVPLAAVVHFEGRSISSSEKEAQMQSNMEKFYAKHADRLDSHCPSPRGWAQTCRHMVDIKRGMFFNTISRQGSQVLFLHERLPEADPEAGPSRLLEMVRVVLGMGYGVSLHRDSGTSLLKHMLPLLGAGVHVLRPGALREMAAERAGMKALPGAKKAFCPWQAAIVSGGRRNSNGSAEFDLLREVCPRIPLIYDSVGDGESVDEGLAKASEFVIASSAEEPAMVEKVGQDKVRALVEVLPGPAHSDEGPDFASRQGGLFVGSMCFPADVEAIKYIARDIFSDHTAFPAGFMRMVWLDTAKCKHLGDVWSETKHPLIELHFDITDKELHKLYARARFFLAPKSFSRFAARALGYGLPLIGSEAAAMGGVLTASDPTSFRDGMRRLEEEKLWRETRRAGFLAAERHFGHEAAGGTLQSIFATLGVAPRVSKSGPDGRLVAAPVWKCPLPDDGKWGLFPGRQDADCWSGKGRNPWVLMASPDPYENELLADG